jgi:hypothetical protein
VAGALHPGEHPLFDYVGKRIAEGERLRDKGPAASATRYPAWASRFRFGTNDPIPLLHDAGFRHVLTLTSTRSRSP